MESEDTWMQLQVLHRHGCSISALAREFGLNWRTARRHRPEPPRYPLYERCATVGSDSQSNLALYLSTKLANSGRE